MSVPPGSEAEVVANSPERLRELARRLAAELRAGDLVVLSGPLGAGKTVFVQGLAAGLGVRGPVTSPTFVLARVHRDGRVPLVHVDAYRLGSAVELDDLDLDEDLDAAVVAVEWGAGLVEQLSPDRLEVTIRRDEDEPGADGPARPPDPEDPGGSDLSGDDPSGGDPSGGGGVRTIRLRGLGARWSGIDLAEVLAPPP